MLAGRKKQGFPRLAWFLPLALLGGPGVHAAECPSLRCTAEGVCREAVAVSADDGFWALNVFNGRLYAGTHGTGKILRSRDGGDAPFRFSEDLDAGESVYDLQEFGSCLYASTENRGEIWRTCGGRDWTKVFRPDDLGDRDIMGTGLAVFGGRLYAAVTRFDGRPPGRSRIYRTATGTRWRLVFENASGLEIRELLEYEGELHALAYDFDAETGGFLTSASGRRGTWSWKPVARLREVRPVHACTWGGFLWLAAGAFPDGFRIPPASVYRWNGRFLRRVFADRDRAVGTAVVPFQGSLWFLDMVRWHAPDGRAALYRSPTGERGTWSRALTFPEPEGTFLYPFGDRLFVSTLRDWSSDDDPCLRGKLYQVTEQ